MLKNILFITEKWCDGNPEMGLTNHYHNLFTALNNTGLATISIVHFDELIRESHIHIDNCIDHYLDMEQFDVVVVSLLGTAPVNPSILTFKKIKERGIKLVFTWPDTRLHICNMIHTLDMADLHVSWACEGDDDKPLCGNHIWLWTPEDLDLYWDDTKTIDVSFIGSLNGYQNVRRNTIQYLMSNGINVNVTGGQREQKLDQYSYAKLIRQSKININFSESAWPGIHQCKGRVFETMASNSLLLESENEATRRRATPGEHYIEFSSKEDLVDKIKYYLNTPNKRLEIARNGFNHYHKNYTAEIYWKIVFDKLK